MYGEKLTKEEVVKQYKERLAKRQRDKDRIIFGYAKERDDKYNHQRKWKL